MKKIIRFLCSGNAAILAMSLWSFSCIGMLWFGGEWAFKGLGDECILKNLGGFENMLLTEILPFRLPSIFMLLSCFFMLCLLCISIKRIIRFKCKIKDISFLLNHLGLFILVLFLALSQIYLQKLYCPLYKGQTTSIAINAQGYAYHLPFSITLKNTHMELDVLLGPGPNESVSDVLLGPGPNESVSDVLLGPGPNESVSDEVKNETALNIKNYHSDLEINYKKIHKANISVNHPFSLKEWTLYQYSFSPKSDQTPARSTILLVRNPWVNGVYCGVLLCLLGSFGLLFTLKKQPLC